MSRGFSNVRSCYLAITSEDLTQWEEFVYVTVIYRVCTLVRVIIICTYKLQVINNSKYQTTPNAQSLTYAIVTVPSILKFDLDLLGTAFLCSSLLNIDGIVLFNPYVFYSTLSGKTCVVTTVKHIITFKGINTTIFSQIKKFTFVKFLYYFHCST
jgi:hypothetical protein